MFQGGFWGRFRDVSRGYRAFQGDFRGFQNVSGWVLGTFLVVIERFKDASEAY